MIKEQATIAFIAGLILHCDVKPEQIEAAVNLVLDIKLGETICDDNQLIRAFSMEQASRLNKA